MRSFDFRKAKLFLLGCEALQGRWATTTSFEDACKELSELIRAMPLNEKFVFVDTWFCLCQGILYFPDIWVIWGMGGIPQPGEYFILASWTPTNPRTVA